MNKLMDIINLIEYKGAVIGVNAMINQMQKTIFKIDNCLKEFKSDKTKEAEFIRDSYVNTKEVLYSLIEYGDKIKVDFTNGVERKDINDCL